MALFIISSRYSIPSQLMYKLKLNFSYVLQFDLSLEQVWFIFPYQGTS